MPARSSSICNPRCRWASGVARHISGPVPPVSSLWRWHADASALQWREWDGEFVVRDVRSGATHLLAQASGTILVYLTQSASPLTAQDLARHLGGGETTDEPVTAPDIERILLELERIALVARVGA